VDVDAADMGHVRVAADHQVRMGVVAIAMVDPHDTGMDQAAFATEVDAGGRSRRGGRHGVAGVVTIVIRGIFVAGGVCRRRFDGDVQRSRGDRHIATEGGDTVASYPDVATVEKHAVATGMGEMRAAGMVESMGARG
jgi:hypothetical protein